MHIELNYRMQIHRTKSQHDMTNLQMEKMSKKEKMYEMTEK